HQTTYPENTANNVIKGKFFEVHLHDTRNDRGKRADNGQKTCENNRHAALFFVKFLCSVNICLLEEPIIGSLHESVTEKFTTPISHKIANNCGCGYQGYPVHQRHHGINCPKTKICNDDTSYEEDRISRQKETKKNSGFCKNNKQ